jgi:hypothetical protein
MKTYLLLSICFVSLFNSCKRQEAISKKTESFQYEFTELNPLFSKGNNFSTSVDLDLLEAESINLISLFDYLIEDDIIIKFQPSEIGQINLEINAQEFKASSHLKKELFDAIVKKLELKIKQKKENVLELVIVDSLKLRHDYNTNNNLPKSSKVYSSKDSFAIENLRFDRFCKLINKRFEVNTASKNTSNFINAHLKFEDFNQFKIAIKNKLGLELKKSHEQKMTYLVSEK